MNPERWQQIEFVLQAALDHPPQERAAYLDAACAGDEALKDEATQLIIAHDTAGEFMEQPAIAQDARVLIGDDADINIGRVIGPYRIVRELGVGGMGEVYLAQDARLGRLVALKILLSYFASDNERLRRFQREARAASALNHQNILTIYEVGEADGVHFISTEFIDGQTLRELIPAKGLPLAETLDIAMQVASALEAAHAAGIIHRDIKPENIMRRADGTVKILDFGIAKLTEAAPSESSSEALTIIKSQTETGVVMGTVGYMSPEQARGLTVDERTDIWSLGCVLYEMLSGRAPFAGATRIDTLVAVLEREPAPLFHLTEDAPAQLQQLQGIIIRALRKERDERYKTVPEMLADLRSAGDEIALVPATPGSIAVAPQALSSITDQEARQAQRRILRAFLVVVLLIAAVFFYSRSAARREANLRNAPAATTATTATKLYAQMSEAEQLAFINEQEQKISAQMGENPVKLNEDALRAIKRNVDSYVARLGSTSAKPGRDDLHVVYARAVPYLPLIARSFAARKVPLMVGIYLPMIESEYRPCAESSLGAKGIFQFLPQTARLYGIAYEEMCDMEKMTPAAAHHIADLMAELGDDAESMTLVLLSYNRGPDWVRNTLRQLRETGDYERNFWTLFINRDKLDETFRNENAGYVPRFFAAAIIGENPQTFELQNPPLTTMAEPSAPAAVP
ncbi:MAG: protein kinase [Acidobacteria bacterium]|nr:protein kinase [Acidobacteriota bacterium]